MRHVLGMIHAAQDNGITELQPAMQYAAKHAPRAEMEALRAEMWQIRSILRSDMKLVELERKISSRVVKDAYGRKVGR